MALVTTQDAAPVARQAARAKSADRLTEFLTQSIEQSPDKLAGQYGEAFDSGGGFDFGQAQGLGMDPVAAGAINARMKDLLNKNVGFQRANLLRGSVGDYMGRQDQVQSIHDAANRQRMLQEQLAAQKKAAKKAKQAGLKTAVLGLAGAGAGAAMGGPTGAMIGSGVGQSMANF